jgi:hypothetical protein
MQQSMMGQGGGFGMTGMGMGGNSMMMNGGGGLDPRASYLGGNNFGRNSMFPGQGDGFGRMDGGVNMNPQNFQRQ